MFKKFTWGHGVIVALASFIAFISFMILVFPNGQQNADLVTEEYYKDELNYQEVIDAKRNAETLKEIPQFKQLPIGIEVSFPETISPDESKIHFDMYRTNDSNLDVKKDLALNSNKSFTIPKEILSKGSYTLKVKWQQNKKPYQIDYDVQWN